MALQLHRNIKPKGSSLFLKVLEIFEDENNTITRYTVDGITVCSEVKIAKNLAEVPTQIELTEQKPTLEEIAETNLLETQYQTLLIEMLAGF